MDFILKQQYYQRPEGEDFTGKMVATNKYMFAFAAPLAACDILMYTHPKGALATVATFAKWVGPAAGMASLFTAGTYFSCILRGKDDK
jgi:NADH dehydrogenase (ubiquinone) 1 alpha subcomplex subunit 11